MLDTLGDFLANSQRIYLFIAVLATAVFVIQFLMSMAGIHGDGGEGDFSVDSHDAADIAGLNFFSIKAIVSFVAFFGWGGYFFGHLGWGGLAIALFCGLLMMFLTALVISLLLKMQQSGNITGEDFVGKSGKVYLSIAAGRAKAGIVTVDFPGCTRQVEALADTEIVTGKAVTVVEKLSDHTFLVKE